MNTICKIVTAATALVGAATVSSAVAERFRKKWFSRGFEAGQIAGFTAAAEDFCESNDEISKAASEVADTAATIFRKYVKLCDDYAELERAYDELCAETDDK